MNPSVQMHPGFADVVDRFAEPIRSQMSWQGHQVFNQIQACRTAAMGGQLLRCDHCQQHRLQYHSCRNRHCPQCGYQASQDWIDNRMKEVLPVTYHHLVFTLPHQLNPWVGRYRDTIYRLFFAAASSTLKTLAADTRRLNGELGAMLVLHTWGQALTRHVHIHCLIPGGALQANGQWKAARSTYLFPVRVLSRYYRGKMVGLLRAHRDAFESVGDHEFTQTLDELMAKDWVVYSKPVITKTETVVGYLARYTKRIGLSNARLLKMDQRHVWLTYRDYRAEGQRRVIQLEGEELLRRFLLHLLPKRFMRVRYYGYLANAHRRRKLIQIRKALEDPPEIVTHRRAEKSEPGYTPICKDCQEPMRFVRALPPERQHHDSS